LCPVKYAQYADDVALNEISNDEGSVLDDELARSVDPAWASALRKPGQDFNLRLDTFIYQKRVLRTLCLNVIEIISRSLIAKTDHSIRITVLCALRAGDGSRNALPQGHERQQVGCLKAPR